MHPAAQVLHFSSVAALLGSAGQAPYASVNGGLDGLAAASAHTGTPSASLQWGAWSGAGMAVRNTATADRVARLGMGMITPAAGLAALQTLMGHPEMPAVTIAVPFLWHLVRQWGSPRAPITHLLTDFTDAAEPESGDLVQSERSSATSTSGEAWLSSVVPTTSGTQVSNVLPEVMGAIASVLGASMGAEEPLMAAGLDSLGALQHKEQLSIGPTAGLQEQHIP